MKQLNTRSKLLDLQKRFLDILKKKIMDDEEVLRQILSAQDGVEFAPTAEMMMMNSAIANGNDSIDPELIAAIQQQQHISRVHPPGATATITEVDSDDDLLLEDETILERVVALKEMFPESVQNAVSNFNHAVINTSKLAYSKGRTAAWWYDLICLFLL